MSRKRRTSTTVPRRGILTVHGIASLFQSRFVHASAEITQMPSKKGSTRSARLKDHLAIRYYRLGLQLLERDVVSGEEFERLAAELGLRAGADAWYKSIRLAKYFNGKSADLKKLCRLRTDGRQITWTHLLELLQIPSATQREKLAARAARLNLSCITLRAEIRRTNGWTSKRPGAGRKRREPRNEADAVWRANRKIERLKTTLEWLKTNERRRFKLRNELSGAVIAIDGLQKSLKRLFGIA